MQFLLRHILFHLIPDMFRDYSVLIYSMGLLERGKPNERVFIPLICSSGVIYRIRTELFPNRYHLSHIIPIHSSPVFTGYYDSWSEVLCILLVIFNHAHS